MMIDNNPIRIESDDVDELNYSVFPWDLDMRQMSSGQLHAKIDLVQLGGILVNHEHWSQSISAVGATPANYLAVAGCCTERAVKWNGVEIDAQHMMCGFDAREIEFVTPVDSDHWVILIPKDLIIGHLGEESAADLLHNNLTLECARRHTRQIISLVDRALGQLPGGNKAKSESQPRIAIQSALLDIITKILLLNDMRGKHSTPRKRYLACRKAIIHAMKLRTRIPVPELAAVAGVSQRVLELGFRETVGVSPQKFLRLTRMNNLHRDLRDTRPANQRVTELCNRWGFTELGRTAVEYKRLFGQSPSSTLREEAQSQGIRILDALPETT